jgi:predicted aldo/keto reductase-like oxidoreductase
MEHRILGRTKLKVSALGFGGIPIQTLRRRQAVAVVRRALDLGINFIDTARAYTTSEERIGEAIDGQRGKCVLATKTGARSSDQAKKDLETSLSLLKVSSVDLYQLHSINSDEALSQVMGKGGSLQMLKAARREGKIDYIGITSHRPSVLVQAVKSGEFDTVMVPLNYVERTPVRELIPLANKLDIGTIAMKPLGGGAFVNAAEALKFVLSMSVSTVIPGVSSIDEVEQNVALMSTSLELSEKEKLGLEEQAKVLGRAFCRACDYCQPCPEQIPISSLLRVDTFIKRMGWENWISRNRDSIKRYERCQQCRQCESKCPYELPILELLAEKVKWLHREYGNMLDAQD